MKKERVCNNIEAVVVDENHISFAGAVWECPVLQGFEAGEEVIADIPFADVDLMDNKEDGVIAGEVHFLLYKGNRYHLTIISAGAFHIYADTQDTWDKGDLVGINIPAGSITVRKKNEKK